MKNFARGFLSTLIVLLGLPFLLLGFVWGAIELFFSIGRGDFIRYADEAFKRVTQK